jgi:leader peptidase (prepilin peptidase)/N-methyltransferase
MLLASFNFVLGAIFGSFINVCIYRIPKRLDISFERSKCPHCKKQIPWHLNIPILSYLFLGGTSKCCKKKISFQYLFIEFISGIFFLTNFLYLNLNQVALWDVVFLILLIIIAIDYKTYLIFDIFPYALIIIGLLTMVSYPHLNIFKVSLNEALITCAISIFTFWLIRFLFLYFKKVEALGLGDIKLIGGLTIFTGFVFYIYLLLLSSALGILFYLLFKPKKQKAFRIPFGSCLGVAFILLACYKIFSFNFLNFIY